MRRRLLRYVTDGEGRRVGVVLDIRTWNALLRSIENSADVQKAVKALTELRAVGGPGAAGWVAWDKVRQDWR